MNKNINIKCTKEKLIIEIIDDFDKKKLDYFAKLFNELIKNLEKWEENRDFDIG